VHDEFMFWYMQHSMQRELSTQEEKGCTLRVCVRAHEEKMARGTCSTTPIANKTSTYTHTEERRYTRTAGGRREKVWRYLASCILLPHDVGAVCAVDVPLHCSHLHPFALLLTGCVGALMVVMREREGGGAQPLVGAHSRTELHP
jgi:hypothetical protein